MKEYDLSYTQNRELSWLRFNERVLEEAGDSAVPILERLKFVSIFTSNLDEFFMIRVGSLTDLNMMKATEPDNKSGWTPQRQLKEIFHAVEPLYQKRDQLFSQVAEELKNYEICHLEVKDLQGAEKKYVSQYFKNYMLPILSPQVVDPHHPFPHLVNKGVYVVATLQLGVLDPVMGIVPVPPSLPEVLFLPGDGVRFVFMEDVLFQHFDDVFEMYNIMEKTMVCVTRNADIGPEDDDTDMEGDYKQYMKKLLKKRARLAPVRLEVKGDCGPKLVESLAERLGLSKAQVFKTKAPFTMKYAYSLEEKISASLKAILIYPPFTGAYPPDFYRNESVMKQCEQKDILLSYPFETMDVFLQLLKEAARDPDVLSIKITIYRLSSKSKVVEQLCAAAENGKEVTVLMELKARFDEGNNIAWAERLDESGCQIMYGFDGYKVHSKICLITKRVKNNLVFYTQIGTGNYNEKTSHMYTDLSLITANQEIGKDASAFFKDMSISNLKGEYHYLKVAPKSLRPGIMACIDQEIEKAKHGQPARIIMKVNSLTERKMIDKLSEASCAGVKIDLIVRGICCLLPGIAGKTENITVRSIVGRFLEHSRIYCFGVENKRKIYISSADLMTRNLIRRVEIACPILDEDVKKRIEEMLDIIMKDNIKARILLSNGKYAKMNQANGASCDSQLTFLKIAQSRPELIRKEEEPKGFFWKIRRKLRSNR